MLLRLVVRLLLWVRQAFSSLGDALVPPQLWVVEHSMGVIRSAIVGTAARLRFADHLDRPMTSAELAPVLGVDADVLERHLRALCALGLFSRDHDGRFSNNRRSRALKSGPGSVASFADLFANRAFVATWGSFERSLRSGQSAFEQESQKSYWAHLAEHPGEGRVFAEAMVEITQLTSPVLGRVASFARSKKICDVGGGRGRLLEAILKAHPQAQGVLFDDEAVVAPARADLARAGLAGRVEVVGGSFFGEIPKGCDTYVLKDVIHNWDDQRALAILSGCRQAMSKGDRVVILEILLGTPEVALTCALTDLHMLVMHSGGRQRSADQFAQLFRRCGFQLGRVRPTAAGFSAVEGLAI